MEIIHTDFWDDSLPVEYTWKTVVLIPLKNGGFVGIRLVEVFWKVFLGFINRQIEEALQLHDVLHGFRSGRGVGAAAIESKLPQ